MFDQVPFVICLGPSLCYWSRERMLPRHTPIIISISLILPIPWTIPAFGGEISILPQVQFIKEGGRCRLKARARGVDLKNGWKWELLTPNKGYLDSVAFGFVDFVATDAKPWDTVVIHATDQIDSNNYGFGLIYVLPYDAFSIVEDILGKSWIEDYAITAAPIRLDIEEPSFFSLSGSYLFHAELDRCEEDRFTWDIHPMEGTLEKADEPNAGSARNSIVFTPRVGRTRDIPVRIRATHLFNPRFTYSKSFLLPADSIPSQTYSLINSGFAFRIHR